MGSLQSRWKAAGKWLRTGTYWGSASGAADTVTPCALTRQGTAAASEAAAVPAADRIVGDETLEKVRAWQDINNRFVGGKESREDYYTNGVKKSKSKPAKENPEGCNSYTTQRTWWACNHSEAQYGKHECYKVSEAEVPGFGLQMLSQNRSRRKSQNTVQTSSVWLLWGIQVCLIKTEDDRELRRT